VKLWWRAARFLGCDGDPMRRRIDRAESLALTVLVAVLVVAGPALAISVGRTADAAALRQQQALAGSHQSSAILLQGADQVMATTGDWNVAWVKAKWTLPDGKVQHGSVPVSLNAQAGTSVTVWLTPSGRSISRPPITENDIRDQVMFAILLTVTGWAVALAIGVAAVRAVANRRRMACWQREWDVSGPLWSRQR
jgi:type II secretory pathway pseudopilin PulG